MALIKNVPLNLNVFRDDPELMYRAKHIQDADLQFHGHVWTDHYRNGELIHTCDQGSNIFTTEGMNYFLDVMFGTTSKAASAIFYVGIFKNNVTPAAGDTCSAKCGAAGSYGECQDADYDDPATNKPSYTIAAAGSGICTNSASKATFVIADTITVYGAFLSTGQAKTDTAGKLMCAKKFTSSRAVIADDELAVTYQITCTSS